MRLCYKTNRKREYIIDSSTQRNSLPIYIRKEKLKIYNSIGFEIGDNLFITEDDENGSIKFPEIMDVIEKVKKRITELNTVNS